MREVIYKEVLFNIDDDLIIDLNKNFKQNIERFQKENNIYYLGMWKSIEPIDIAEFVYDVDHKSITDEKYPEVIDDKWLEKKFKGHFGIGIKLHEKETEDEEPFAEFIFDADLSKGNK